MSHVQPFMIDDAHRAPLERAGLATLAGCRAFRGGVSVKALVPGRSTVRVDAAPVAFFLKRIEGAATDEIVNEGHVLGVLRALGLPVAEVAAVGAEDGFGALVTVALPVIGTLERELTGGAAPDDPTTSRRRHQVAAILESLHRAGVQHRDFYLAHILVGRQGDLYVADFGRARMAPRLGVLRRSKDLAALDFSTPARLVSDWARVRFLREYAGGASRWRLRILAALARARARSMRRHVERRIAQGAPNFHVTG